MLPSLRRATPHFTHQLPGHILVELHADTEYHCGACKTDGGGTRFQCNNCDYSMHEYCTMCPGTLSSVMHPHHSLTLAVTQSHRTCHICNDDIDGLFFYCQDCDNFNIHPLCTLLPQNLCHALHLAHPLTLQASGPRWCAVCRGECQSWRYRCRVCNFDIHMECVSVPCVRGPINSHVLTVERRIPPYAGYGYNQGVPSTTHDANNNWHAPAPYYGSSGYNHGVPFTTHNAYNNWQPLAPYYGPSGYNQDNYYHHEPPRPYGVPYNFINDGNNMQQGEGSSSITNNSGHGKKMFAIIGQLALGVLSNSIFGLITGSLF